MEDLIEIVRTFLQGLITWFFAVTSPIETTNRLISNPPKQRLNSTLLLLLWSLILSLIVIMALSNTYGIELTSTDFYVQVIVFMLLSWLLSAWTIHLVLRAFGQRSILPELLSILTGTYLVYWPLYQSVMIPFVADNYKIVSTLKKSGTPGEDILSQLLSRIIHPSNYSPGTDTIDKLWQGRMMTMHPHLAVLLHVVASVMMLATLSIFAEFATKWYGNERFRTFLAVSLGVWVSMLLTALVISPLEWMTVWSYID